MSEDNSLFASTNAIGRKWYYVNIIILFLITIATHYVFTVYIIPNVLTEMYNLIAKCIMYFAFLFYIITFLSLIDRRLYDACGSRDSKIYKFVSSIIWITILLHIFLLYYQWKNPILTAVSIDQIYFISMIFDIIFVCIIIFAGIIKGKISSLSFEEYRKKDKYK